MHTLKRKRTQPEDLTEKISKKLHHQLREVVKAAKKVKTFETQKLVKKLKSLRRNVNNIDQAGELEMQLEAVKHVDSDRIARIALKAKLKKHHLSTDPNVLSAMDRHLMTDLDHSHTPGTPAAKVVESRLLSSKVLASETSRVIQDLKAVLFPTLPSDDLTNEDANVSGVVRSPEGRNETGTPDEMDESSLTSDLDSSDQIGSESGSEGEAGQVTSFGLMHESSSDTDETRHREKEYEDPHSGTGVQPLAKSKTSIIAESGSLPPLAVGYTRGDPDDLDWSESEAKPAVMRKNRRGQRARRAIWEKKYGKHANHKKKQNQGNDIGFGNSRIQPFDRSPKKRERPSGVGGVARQNPWHADVSQPAPPRGLPTSQERPLHPSWEAKKKLKEKQSSKVSQARGKKIKFS